MEFRLDWAVPKKLSSLWHKRREYLQRRADNNLLLYLR